MICVATITPRKGHLVLVEALAGMADLDWEMLLVGSLDRDPATAAALREAIAAQASGGAGAPDRGGRAGGVGRALP